MSTDTLFKYATDAMNKAYAPYSNFYVGTCIESNTGKLYTGCNIENASYSLTVCAEACAICAMVSAGDLIIKQVAVIIKSDDIATPCGACRQRMNEFSTPETLIHLGNIRGERATYPLTELLPFAFGKSNLIK